MTSSALRFANDTEQPFHQSYVRELEILESRVEVEAALENPRAGKWFTTRQRAGLTGYAPYGGLYIASEEEYVLFSIDENGKPILAGESTAFRSAMGQNIRLESLFREGSIVFYELAKTLGDSRIMTPEVASYNFELAGQSFGIRPDVMLDQLHFQNACNRHFTQTAHAMGLKVFWGAGCCPLFKVDIHGDVRWLTDETRYHELHNVIRDIHTEGEGEGKRRDWTLRFFTGDGDNLLTITIRSVAALGPCIASQFHLGVELWALPMAYNDGCAASSILMPLCTTGGVYCGHLGGIQEPRFNGWGVVDGSPNKVLKQRSEHRSLDCQQDGLVIYGRGYWNENPKGMSLYHWFRHNFECQPVTVALKGKDTDEELGFLRHHNGSTWTRLPRPCLFPYEDQLFSCSIEFRHLGSAPVIETITTRWAHLCFMAGIRQQMSGAMNVIEWTDNPRNLQQGSLHGLNATITAFGQNWVGQEGLRKLKAEKLDRLITDGHEDWGFSAETWDLLKPVWDERINQTGGSIAYNWGKQLLSESNLTNEERCIMIHLAEEQCQKMPWKEWPKDIRELNISR